MWKFLFEVFLLPNLAGSKKEEERKNRTRGGRGEKEKNMKRMGKSRRAKVQEER